MQKALNRVTQLISCTRNLGFTPPPGVGAGLSPRSASSENKCPEYSRRLFQAPCLMDVSEYTGMLVIPATVRRRTPHLPSHSGSHYWPFLGNGFDCFSRRRNLIFSKVKAKAFFFFPFALGVLLVQAVCCCQLAWRLQ